MSQLNYNIGMLDLVIIIHVFHRLTGFLGSGQFGNVDKGMMRTSGGMYIEVAVKTLSPVEQQEHSKEDKVRFLQEAAIMAQFKHPNVVKLYGVVQDGGAVRE